MSADYRLRHFDCTDCIAPVGFADKRSVYRSIICVVYGIVLLRAVSRLCFPRGCCNSDYSSPVCTERFARYNSHLIQGLLLVRSLTG